MTEPLRNNRHEAFARLLLEGQSQSDAFRAVYRRAHHWKASAVHERDSKLAAKVAPRVRVLQELAASDAVMTVLKRKERLSRIAEEVGGVDPADYLDVGPHGTSIKFDRDSPRRLAVADIQYRVVTSAAGGERRVISGVHFRPFADAIAAIRELNAMEGVYPEPGHGESIPRLLLIYEGSRERTSNVQTTASRCCHPETQGQTSRIQK